MTPRDVGHDDELMDAVDFLEAVEQGRFLDDVTASLHECVAALHRAERHGASAPKAKLALAFTLVMDRGTLDVRPVITKAMPQPKRPGTLLFATPAGRLVKSDQAHQVVIPFETTTGREPAQTAAVAAPAAATAAPWTPQPDEAPVIVHTVPAVPPVAAPDPLPDPLPDDALPETSARSLKVMP